MRSFFPFDEYGIFVVPILKTTRFVTTKHSNVQTMTSSWHTHILWKSTYHAQSLAPFTFKFKMALRKLKSYLLTFVREVSSLKFSLFTVYLFISARISLHVRWRYLLFWPNIYKYPFFLRSVFWLKYSNHNTTKTYYSFSQMCKYVWTYLHNWAFYNLYRGFSPRVKSILCYFSLCRDIQRRQRL